jgi:hypothetical protein
VFVVIQNKGDFCPRCLRGYVLLENKNEMIWNEWNELSLTKKCNGVKWNEMRWDEKNWIESNAMECNGM